MITNGNSWDESDTESDEFYMLDQDEGIKKQIRQSKIKSEKQRCK